MRKSLRYLLPVWLVWMTFLFQKASTLQSVPSWEELDQRPLAPWYQQAKFGIFLHWGVFSVPSFKSEWFQVQWQGYKSKDYQDFVQATEKPGFSYSEYAARFRAEFYQPEDWAKAFAQAGAQYIVLTSKHHEGYCMWDSRDVPATWNWNVMDVGPRRDVLGDLAQAIKNTTSPLTGEPIQFGVYHSLYEWFNPMYVQDRANKFNTSTFVDRKTLPELYDLVNKYQPTVIWSDGHWEAHSDYWKAREFLDWYSRLSPVASQGVWNDRWGFDAICHHGAYLTCGDRYHPDQAMSRYWEKCLSLDRTSWGFNRNAALEDYLTVPDLIHELIATVAMNGNFLLNIGPAADGRLPTIFLDRLHHIGEWLKVNGEGIYATSAWPVCTNETVGSGVYYTYKPSNRGSKANAAATTVYAHVTQWPKDNIVRLTCMPMTPRSVHMLGVHTPLAFGWAENGDMLVDLPLLTPGETPCHHSWVLAIELNEGQLRDSHAINSIK